MIATLVFAAGSLIASTPAANGPTSDWIIPPHTTATYDTAQGPLKLGRFEIGVGATLRVVGDAHFHVEAGTIQLDGVLDVSGFDANDVLSINNPDVPELGAAGGPGGGCGGTASRNITSQTYRGESGYGPRGQAMAGGLGGEGAWGSISGLDATNRRAAGGGGGRFGPPELVVPGDLEHPANIGLVARSGVGGAKQGTGSLFGHLGPIPGAAGPRVFVDGTSANDFFGVHPSVPPLVGELQAPRGGQGGGAGGDAFYLPTGVFPPSSLVAHHTDKGAGGGGGGGLAILVADRFRMGPLGRILANGGDGASGESAHGVFQVGGGSGGGSGGMILLQSPLIDLSRASLDALQAKGGRGGLGADFTHHGVGAGGHGGPGVIQVHLVPGDVYPSLIFPAGLYLPDLSVPDAHRVLPVTF